MGRATAASVAAAERRHASGTHRVTVLTYNTHLFGGTVVSLVGKLVCEDDVRARQIPFHLLSRDADVIGLTEVWGTRFKQEIAASLHNVYPFSYTDTRDWYNIGSGLLLLSRYPLEGASFTPFTDLLGADVYAKKGFISAVVRLDADHEFRVILTHLQAHNNEPSIRARISNLRQIRQELLSHAAVRPLPVLLMGDLNVPGEDQQGRVHSEYRDLRMFMSKLGLVDLYRVCVTAEALQLSMSQARSAVSSAASSAASLPSVRPKYSDGDADIPAGEEEPRTDQVAVLERRRCSSDLDTEHDSVAAAAAASAAEAAAEADGTAIRRSRDGDTNDPDGGEVEAAAPTAQAEFSAGSADNSGSDEEAAAEGNRRQRGVARSLSMPLLRLKLIPSDEERQAAQRAARQEQKKAIHAMYAADDDEGSAEVPAASQSDSLSGSGSGVSPGHPQQQQQQQQSSGGGAPLSPKRLKKVIGQRIENARAVHENLAKDLSAVIPEQLRRPAPKNPLDDDTDDVDEDDLAAAQASKSERAAAALRDSSGSVAVPPQQLHAALKQQHRAAAAAAASAASLAPGNAASGSTASLRQRKQMMLTQQELDRREQAGWTSGVTYDGQSNDLVVGFCPTDKGLVERLDYIWIAGAQWLPVSAEVCRDFRFHDKHGNSKDLSDHYPLLATLDLATTSDVDATSSADVAEEASAVAVKVPSSPSRSGQ